MVRFMPILNKIKVRNHLPRETTCLNLEGDFGGGVERRETLLENQKQSRLIGAKAPFLKSRRTLIAWDVVG